MNAFCWSFRWLTISWLCVKQTTGSLYFWAAHLAGPKWGPFASWCCAWLETIGLIAGIGTQVPFFQIFYRVCLLIFLVYGKLVIIFNFFFSLTGGKRLMQDHKHCKVSFYYALAQIRMEGTWLLNGYFYVCT